MKANRFTSVKFTAVLIFTMQLCYAADLYVSPKGNDSHPGTRKAPLATLKKARDAVRAIPAEQKSDGVTVHLDKGRYTLTEQLVLTPQDSGATATAPITWSGQRGVSISGGRPITNWTRIDRNLWKAKVDWLDKDQVFYSLFADGKRLTRARTPNEGSYLYTRKLIYDQKSRNICIGMAYNPGTIPEDIETDDAHIVLFHKWVTSQNFVRSIDKETRKIMFKQHAGIFLFDPETRFYVEGVRSALDTPGEWFLNPQSHELLLQTEEGTDPNDWKIIAPSIQTSLILINGSGTADEKVRNLVFENITFEYTDANLTQSHPRSVQGAQVQRGAFTATGLHDSVIRNCTFTRIGESGICLLNGCRNNLIEQNHIYDMGCGGVYLPEQKPARNTDDDLCAYNTIQDNLIHDGGIIFRAGVGVFLGGNASYNKILHNEIFNLSWMGIHAGWSWTGLVPTGTHHNEIGFNHIHHIGNGVLCDIGGIYTLGISTGTVLHNNRIHDVRRYTRGTVGYGAWGIYLDAGSSQITVTSNLVYNTQDGGFHLHNDNFPWGNKAENNIFAIADSAQLKRGNIDDTTNGFHLVFENNIVYCTNNLTYGGGNWKTNSVFTADRNCFYSTSEQPLDFAGYDFRTWQAAGKDRHSLIADPLFKDAANYDFKIPPLSPAITLGFKPFDYTQAGLTPRNPLRKLISGIDFRPVEIAEIDKRPFTIDEGYEDDAIDGQPSTGQMTKRIKNMGYIISADQAASGSQSLKIADGPDFPLTYQPHLWHYLPEQDGTWKIAFDLYHTSGASLSFESREWPPSEQYRSGPAFQIKGDGTVKADSHSFKIKPACWTSFEILCTQGDGVWASWELKINAGRADEQHLSALVSNPAFHKLTWFGFISPDKNESIVYLDNLKAELLPEKN